MLEPDFTFRPETCDENVFRVVVEQNEYRLPDRFAAEDLILDVGAHIGSFAQACLARGSRRIFCFEPDWENYRALRRNLATAIHRGWVFPHLLAIGGAAPFSFRLHSGYTRAPGEKELNTGGGFMFGSGAELVVPSEALAGRAQSVATVPLDNVLLQLAGGRVRFLKLDCEYSEWEICSGSALMATMVQELAGEYHSHGARTPEALTQGLTNKGYSVTCVPHDGSNLGLFFAKK